MVQFGFDSDDDDQVNNSSQQKFQLRKPITPYVSSTPCDFDLERNYLATEIFPKLHDICRHRGTAFNPIDIQWAPNSVQTESGHLLRINLDFISKCSPFFLCLLGETYGPHRTPDEKKLPNDLTNLPDDCSWLDKSYLVAASAGYKWILKEMHQYCSVPELEIIQAAFLSDNRYCHFYYRQPEHLDHLFPGLSQTERNEKSIPYKPVSEYADLKIRDLKQRIVNKGLPVKYFQTKEELGQHVLTDWLEVIDSLYPPLLDGPALYDTEEFREWLHHEVFSESRRQIYLTYPELNTIKEQLTDFCMGILDEPILEMEDTYNNPYRGFQGSNVLRKQKELNISRRSVLVVKAERGSGKSALIANWVKQFSSDNPEIKTITHFVGSSGRSRDVSTFMRLCINEMRDHFLKDEHSIGPDREAVSQNFKSLSGCFQAAIGLGPCLLILDGVDELGDSLGMSPQEVKKFHWLPQPLPPQCCVILTTISSDLTHTNLSQRQDVQFLQLTHLNTTKLKAEFLEDSMQMYYDHLKKMHLHTLFESRLSGKPLFLKIVGIEMSAYSVYTDLDVYTEMIREMCTSIRDLYVRCIKRWSNDHSWTYEVLSAEQMESENIEYIGWVADILRLIAVSRSGLTANEILEILEMIGYQENVKVTQFDWLMFRQCMGDNITESPYGIVNFAHQHMREVVEYVLLRTVKPSTAEIVSVSDVDKDWKKQKSEFHQYLVTYFSKQPHSQRQTEELPWQQLMAGDIQGLKTSLRDPELFVSLYDKDGRNPSNYYDLKTYWYYLEKDGHKPTTNYLQVLQKLDVLELEPEPSEVQSSDGSIDESRESKSPTRFSPSHSDGVTSPVIPLINIPRYTGDPHKLSVIEEASDVLSYKDERTGVEERGTSPEDSVFVTQSSSQFGDDQEKCDLDESQITNLTWYISQFLWDLGHKSVVEKILHSLQSWLVQRYPLTGDDQLIQAKVQDCLGRLYTESGDLDLAERWYKKALRTVMDMFDTEETSPVYAELQILKCVVIQQIGYLRLQEGLLEDADDLLLEAIELAEMTHKIPVRATVLFHIGNLRHKQDDFLMAETNLRKCLILRQKWYGQSHPLVAETLFALGLVMADEFNDKGFDKMAALDVFRKCLDVREFHFEKDSVKIAEVLFEIGKILKSDKSYGGKAECHKVLERALDIRITKLGGDHIETRAVRQYINNLETSLKSAKFDPRSSERPYSSMSWRGNDLANLEKKSRITSAKSSSYGRPSRPGSLVSRTGSHRSRPGSYTISRPVSGQQEQLPTYRSNLSHLSASERLLVEASKPSRLLKRESVDRKLKQKITLLPNQQSSPRLKEQTTDDSKKQISIEIDTSVAQDPEEGGISAALLDSFGQDTDKVAVKFRTSPLENGHSEGVVVGRETPPQRLYRRFGSPQGSEHMKASNEGTVMRVGEMTFVRSSESLTPSRKDSAVKHKRPAGSARSIGSSLYTMASATSMGSTKSHKSTRDSPIGPHSIHMSNARTITIGPNSSIKSLMGYHGPKDISRGIHHKSAWYHVPGRYSTVDKKVAPKRSQRRQEAKDLKQRIPKTEPDPYITFMRSEYRKNNPQNVKHCGHISKHEITYPPYPKDNRKQYIICDKCQRDAEEIVAARERELIGLVDGSLENLQLEPTVNPLMSPDRPKQVTYIVEDPISQEELDYGRAHATVKFQDPVIVN